MPVTQARCRLMQGPGQTPGLVPVHSCPTCGARPSENGARGHSVALGAEVDDPGVLGAADEVKILRQQKDDLIGQVNRLKADSWTQLQAMRKRLEEEKTEWRADHSRMLELEVETRLALVLKEKAEMARAMRDVQEQATVQPPRENVLRNRRPYPAGRCAAEARARRGAPVARLGRGQGDARDLAREER